MSITEIDFECPIFKRTCMTEKCVAYEVKTQQKFKDLINDRYIPVDKLKAYENMTPEEREHKIQREVTIWRTCRQLGTMISMETIIDHEIPSEVM